MIRFHSSSGQITISCPLAVPALQTRTSSRPRCRSMASIWLAHLQTRSYVCLIERSLSTDLREKRQGLFSLLNMHEIVHADPPAGTGKGQTEFAPDATGTAGDQHGPALWGS